MRRRQTEEAGKAERLNPRIQALQRAAEHLRADVDAERRLKRGALGRAPARRQRERRRQFPLSRAFRRLLKDGVDHEIGRRLDRRGVRLPHNVPGVGDLGAVAVMQRLLPKQPDGEEVGDRVVGAAGKLRLPQLVAGVLRPSAERHQHLMKVGLQRRSGEAEPFHDARRDGGGAFGSFRDMQREARQTRDLRGEIVGGDRPPRRIGALAARRRPQRLTFIEITGRPGAEPLGNQARPINSRHLRREIGDGAKRAGLWRGLACGGLQG